MAYVSLTELAHARVREVLREGDAAIDATCGNGLDTLFLAQCVGPSGRVLAFDVQRQAVERTRERLCEQGLKDRVSVLHAGHETLREHLARVGACPLRVVMFNLGYLPGASKTLITQTETTLRALDQAWQALAEGGLLSVMIYPGHSGGDAEALAVKDWVCARNVALIHEAPRPPHGPEALFLRKG